MTQQKIPISKLKAGDIFLCVFEHPKTEVYFEALLTMIKKYNYSNEKEYIEFMESALIILRGLIITFDDDIYTHAAFWNGEAVVEAGLSGVKANPIDHYTDTITDVYRFIKNDKELGDLALPIEPLLEESQLIVDQHLNYSYQTAYLYILLCLTRWKREEWIQTILDFLKGKLSSNASQFVEILFTVYKDKLIAIFEWMADEMIRQIVNFRNDDGLVCSETVAKIYNETKPFGKYQIDKPLLIDTKSSPPIRMTSGNHVKESILKELTDSLKIMEIRLKAADLSLPETPTIDIEYTPHDLARSENTYLAGRLVL